MLHYNVCAGGGGERKQTQSTEPRHTQAYAEVKIQSNEQQSLN